jgi:hypothetical protein
MVLSSKPVDEALTRELSVFLAFATCKVALRHTYDALSNTADDAWRWLAGPKFGPLLATYLPRRVRISFCPLLLSLCLLWLMPEGGGG